MMSNNNFVGYLVSVESKNLFFQGVINLIDTKNSIIQLKNCFQNGINLGDKLVDIKTSEIENIEILADPIKAASLLKPINETEKLQEPKTTIQNAGKMNNRYRSKIISPNNQYPKRNYNGNQQNSQDCFNSQNEDSLEEDFDFEKNLALFDKNAFYEKMEGHPRQSKNLTFNESTNSIKKNPSDESTFIRYHQISVDNLFSSVSKQQKPAENRHSLSHGTNGQHSSKETGSKNYRFDEMILDTGEPINFRQIQLPNQYSIGKNYVTDDGFIVPCIDLSLKETLFKQSYNFGFNKQRQIECMGRCCAEMCLQLLGGSIRFLPKNNHQKPSILVLANNYSIQGVYALCTSRLLSIRSVKIYLLIIKSNEEDSVEFKNELNFFKSNFDSVSCFILKGVNDLNKIKSIDLILNGLDSFVDESCLLKSKNQANIQNLKKFVQTCKANVLSIDPSVQENVLQSKWCLTPILPMQMSNNSGRVYLCDMGFTKQIFDSVNIKYQSPFGAKFVIPLHDD
ncbi:enhancer of mRNA-decapping 3 [Brachionus plicatilis]|uniref:Enhancer of mRNA-decapping 3 n=1 Tax=Brachionus plicatilis TaxID=10195 RepID=A0A3M7P9K6_BRAPC|nr:enhancer of mRNA-decapping 3 [Brachionus plicatilis]